MQDHNESGADSRDKAIDKTPIHNSTQTILSQLQPAPAPTIRDGNNQPKRPREEDSNTEENSRKMGPSINNRATAALPIGTFSYDGRMILKFSNEACAIKYKSDCASKTTEQYGEYVLSDPGVQEKKVKEISNAEFKNFKNAFRTHCKGIFHRKFRANCMVDIYGFNKLDNNNNNNNNNNNSNCKSYILIEFTLAKFAKQFMSSYEKSLVGASQRSKYVEFEAGCVDDFPTAYEILDSITYTKLTAAKEAQKNLIALNQKNVKLTSESLKKGIINYLEQNTLLVAENLSGEILVLKCNLDIEMLTRSINNHKICPVVRAKMFLFLDLSTINDQIFKNKLLTLPRDQDSANLFLDSKSTIISTINMHNKPGVTRPAIIEMIKKIENFFKERELSNQDTPQLGLGKK